MTSKKDISNTLCSENYTQNFKNIKQQKEKRNLKISSDNSETCKRSFSLSKPKYALSKAHDSSPGPDDIHYQFFKHLPDSSLSIHLIISGKTGNVPRGWSGGAMVLGKLPVPGRPTLWITVGQGPTALAVGAGGGCLDIFYSHLSFLSSFPPFLGDGPI